MSRSLSHVVKTAQRMWHGPGGKGGLDPTEQKESGARYAMQFLATNPTDAEFSRLMGQLEEGMAIDPEPWWARAAWDVLRQSGAEGLAP